jgi:hypothetical protein
MTPAWGVPDVYFSHAQRAAAQDVVQRDLGGPAVVGFAFLGGSLAVGLGHAASDVDVYAVGDDLPDTELVYESGGVTVHVAPIRGQAVRRMVEVATEYAATGDERDQLYVDFKTLNLLVRLATCIPILTTPTWASTVDRLRRDVVRKILIARNTNMFVAYAEDVAGALSSGDRYTAIGASAIALEAAMEATLAAADDLYIGPKFLHRRLSRTAVTAPWAPTVWHLLNQTFDEWPPADDGLEQVRRIVERRLHVGNLLATWAALEGWDTPLRSLPKPASVSPEPLRSPYFAPIRFTDGWALMGPEHAYETNEATVRLWRDLTPGDDGPLVRALADVGAIGSNPPLPGTPAPPDPDLPPEFRLRWAPRFTIHPSVAPAQRHATPIAGVPA